MTNDQRELADELERCRIDRGIGERVTIPLVLRDRILAALRTPEANGGGTVDSDWAGDWQYDTPSSRAEALSALTRPEPTPSDGLAGELRRIVFEAMRAHLRAPALLRRDMMDDTLKDAVNAILSALHRIPDTREAADEQHS